MLVMRTGLVCLFYFVSRDLLSCVDLSGEGQLMAFPLRETQATRKTPWDCGNAGRTSLVRTSRDLTGAYGGYERMTKSP